ncbi:MAG: fructose-6-phosphate aldolase [Lachnospiraceae bacterium]|nr:fructose-6-phosphate aldolase [Lachnospiraceae bacterium]
MKFCIDDANTEAIRRLCAAYPIDGVTTNPSILASAKRPPFEVLKEIREIIGYDRDLYVQAISPDADGMLREARKITDVLGKDTLVKIPCVTEGFRAMQMLHDEGIRFIGTAVYTPMQGFLAAKCGAEYVATYVNRIDNMGFDGIRVTKTIHDMIVRNGYTHSGVLAAALKNSQQVIAVIEYGIKGITVPSAVIDAFCKNTAIDSAVAKFTEDFEALTAPGITMETC